MQRLLDTTLAHRREFIRPVEQLRCLWDVETGPYDEKLVTLFPFWQQHILTSVCGVGRHHDARFPRHEVKELLGHTGGLVSSGETRDSLRAAVIGNDLNI